MNTPDTPPVESDARNRALRTLAQGLALDVAAGVATALVAVTAAGVDWTRAYWIALGLAVAKSAVTAAVSYFARKAIPPPGAGS